jgi:hypothetical protein
VRGDKAARVTLKLRVDGGEWLEVVDGLSRADEIVTAGADVLADGAAIRAQRGFDPFVGRSTAEAPVAARP